MSEQRSDLPGESTRVCNECGQPLVMGHAGYTHRDGPDRHVPTPVRRRGAGQPAFDRPDFGHKRPSGSAALFTKGDGR